MTARRYPLFWAPLVWAAVVTASCSEQPAASEGARPVESAPRIIFHDAKTGRQVTDADLKGAAGTFRYEIVGAEKITPRAAELHQRARLAGGAGKYSEALELLAAAQKEAPGWPYPAYDAAYTRLLMGDAGGALEGYRSVVRMSPRGFFTALTAVDVLGREQAGTLPRGTYRRLLMLEFTEDPAAKRAELERMTRETPGFAPAWKGLALLLDDDTSRLKAIEMGLKARPNPETRGVLLVNKAAILGNTGRRDEAVRILGGLATDPAVPLDVEQIAKVALAGLAAASPTAP